VLGVGERVGELVVETHGPSSSSIMRILYLCCLNSVIEGPESYLMADGSTFVLINCLLCLGFVSYEARIMLGGRCCVDALVEG